MSVVVEYSPTSVPLGVGSWSVVGAASIPAALADASDASYALSSIAASPLVLGFTIVPAANHRYYYLSTAFTNGLRVSSNPPNSGFVAPGRTWARIGVGSGSDTPQFASDGVGVTDGGQVVFSYEPWKPGGISNAELGGLLVYIEADSSALDLRIQRFGVRVGYHVQPVVDVIAPTDPVTDTTRPTVGWNRTLDTSFGAQISYEIRLFTAAQYGIGGFDPATSPATWSSGQVSSGSNAVQLGVDVVDGVTYRAYVRIAQNTHIGPNAGPYWSLWDFQQFLVDLAEPGAPTFTVTADDANGRVVFALDDTAGAAGTDGYEIQRQDPVTGEWVDVRGGELVPDGAGVVDWFDAEGWPGLVYDYRARAISYDTGARVAGPWSLDDGGWDYTASQLTDCLWWLKSPTRPTLNVLVRVAYARLPQLSRPRRSGFHEILGSTDVVPVQDVRRSPSGTVGVATITAAEHAALLDVLTRGGRLLLQAPFGDLFGSVYMGIPDVDEGRPALAGLLPRDWTLPFRSVPVPVGGPDPDFLPAGFP